ncbi:MAG: hypothetical protein IKQ31_02830 [Clostridia bacterium]|nr:hypothetical protein [Clostridia bacterium]
MKRLILGKTLLESYKNLQRIINSIDRLVVESSAHSYSLTQVSEDTMEKMQAVIDLIERKKRLLGLKMMIEEGLKQCSPLEAKILVRYYFDRVSTVSMAEELGMIRRNVHRKLNTSIIVFVQKLAVAGYDRKTIVDLIANEDWIVGIYNKYVDKFKHKDEKLDYLVSTRKSGLSKYVNAPSSDLGRRMIKNSTHHQVGREAKGGLLF